MGSLAGALAITSAALATPSVDQRIEKLEREMKQVSVKNVTGTTGAQFASGQMKVAGKGWFFEGQALLWHAKAAGTDWVLVLDQGIFPQQGYMKNLDFGWDWGFRFIVGKCFSHDNWDTQLNYTRFHTNGSSKIDLDFQTPQGTGGTTGAGPSGRSDGSYQYKLSYDSIDLDLGKSFFVSCKLNLRPHAGIKTMWMNQKGNLRSENFIDALDTFLPVAGEVNTRVIDQSKFWGIGPKAGVAMDWFFTKNIKLNTALDGSLQWSYFQVTQEEDITVAPQGATPTVTETRLKGNMHRFVPTLRMLIGLAYGCYVNKDKNHIEVGIDYENNYFWRANQQLNQEDTTPANLTFSNTQPVRLLFDRVSDDVGYQGVTFRARFDF